MGVLAAVAVIPIGNAFYGLKDLKRGIIMPGGRYEKDKDRTFHETAKREAREEIGIDIDLYHMEYLWHGPDGTGDWQCFAFWCPWYKHDEETERAEYDGRIVYPHQLLDSLYAGWYACLFDVLRSKGYMDGYEVVRGS